MCRCCGKIEFRREDERFERRRWERGGGGREQKQIFSFVLVTGRINWKDT